MNRRRFLHSSVAVILGATSGCAGLQEGIQSIRGDTAKNMGESISYEGVQVTPDAYTTSTEVTFATSGVGENIPETAPSGATFLLTHLHVKHVGENKRSFPSRGTFSGTMRDQIKHFYKGEQLDEAMYEDTHDTFIVSGSRLPNYIHVLIQNDMTGQVYSGQASGWLINEIPKGFEPSEVSIKITWGGEGSSKTFKWKLTPEGKRSPQNATGNDSSGNTTIQM